MQVVLVLLFFIRVSNSSLWAGQMINELQQRANRNIATLFNLLQNRVQKRKGRRKKKPHLAKEWNDLIMNQPTSWRHVRNIFTNWNMHWHSEELACLAHKPRQSHSISLAPARPLLLSLSLDSFGTALLSSKISQYWHLSLGSVRIAAAVTNVASCWFTAVWPVGD